MFQAVGASATIRDRRNSTSARVVAGGDCGAIVAGIGVIGGWVGGVLVLATGLAGGSALAAEDDWSALCRVGFAIGPGAGRQSVVAAGGSMFFGGVTAAIGS
jgi:hypothetical protein